MIRIEEKDAWLLLGHCAHANLAGEFARHWKNDLFLPPEPFAHILDAVARHDDSWVAVDAMPVLTPEGNPSAFSSELVGTYDAFEEIDLADYLRVRGEATEKAADRDPYAAILISMHTVNLLTEQADLSTLTPEEAEVHAAFIEGQLQRQQALIDQLRKTDFPQSALEESSLRRGFEFLQACDSLSLLVGVDFAETSTLRHAQATRNGGKVVIDFTPMGDGVFVLDPYPFDEVGLSFLIPYVRVPKAATSCLADFQAAFLNAESVKKKITFIAKSQ
ncbi:DUF3891 family protein [Cerasicoccus fimbriatus]|uniref:DUF3891 family protein n=1 Tax=Cerasicoccus fimbriatus TaxID=3014554 RepID=UPI0022B439AD|nr:DUF3891 family protein [Cerasicoccus sp. TK19100]